jgi:hypothetical protein
METANAGIVRSQQSVRESGWTERASAAAAGGARTSATAAATNELKLTRKKKAVEGSRRGGGGGGDGGGGHDQFVLSFISPTNFSASGRRRGRRLLLP